MAKNPVLKRTRRVKVFAPNSTFVPESASNINVAVESGKYYQVRGKTTLAGSHCWIVVEHNSTKYDVLLTDSEAKLGVFKTIEVPRKR